MFKITPHLVQNIPQILFNKIYPKCVFQLNTMCNTNCLYVPLWRIFCWFSIPFWPPKPYSKFGGMEFRNIPQICGLESKEIHRIWDLEWVREIGVWNASVLGGSKKYPNFLIHNIPPKFGVFFWLSIPQIWGLFWPSIHQIKGTFWITFELCFSLFDSIPSCSKAISFPDRKVAASFQISIPCVLTVWMPRILGYKLPNILGYKWPKYWGIKEPNIEVYISNILGYIYTKNWGIYTPNIGV